MFNNMKLKSHLTLEKDIDCAGVHWDLCKGYPYAHFF